MERWFRQGIAALAILLAAIAASAAFARPAPVQRLYVFGDSYSDIGAGYVDGNGPTAVFYMARELGLELTYPGALGAGPNSSLDFAVSAGKSDDAPGRPIKDNILGRGFRFQAGQFATLAGSRGATFRPDSTVAFIAIGINDGNLPTEQTIANMTDAIATLYAAGLRRFVIADLPEQLPISKATGLRLNPAFAALRITLRKRYPAARFSQSRWGPFFDQVHDAPARYGITNATEPCAPGRALFGRDPSACATPERYCYYHPAHPSTAIHRIVGCFSQLRCGIQRGRSPAAIQMRTSIASLGRVLGR